MVAADARVLCVDDQRDASSLLESHLSGHFDCTIVASAEAALAALENDGPFAVVVSDYMMPGMDGIELFKLVKQRWPDCVRVMVTAVDDLGVAIAALHDGSAYRFVRKPWRAGEIVHAVEEAVAYHRLVQNERRLREELARANANLDEKVQDLDEANELLEYWVEFSPAVLYSFSVDEGELRASYVSKNFLRLTGHERTAAVIDADFWPALVADSDRERYRRITAELAAGQRTHAVLEYDIRHKTGGSVRLVDSMRAVQDGDGNTLELVGAWMDVSDRE
ncbi:MAG: response regulator [Gammaproteobacteria bacterium]